VSNPWQAFIAGLAAHLQADVPACSTALAELERVDVVAPRQDDLYSLADAMVAKANGMGVMVTHQGGKNPDPQSKRLQMGGRISISVWADPGHPAQLLADDLIWLLADSAHGFVLASGPNNLTRRLAITEVGIVPDKRFLIWEAAGEVTRLARPQPVPTEP